MRTPQQVQAEILSVLPRGWAWPDGDPDTYGAAKFLGLANELSLMEGGMEAMLPQVDPRAAPDLLSDYQRVLGPDPCKRDQLPLSSADQAALVFQRWTGTGGCYAGYFMTLATQLGETIQVIEYQPSMCGASVCGDMLVPSPRNCDYLVVLPAARVTAAVCGSAQCGDLIGSFTADLMECVFKTWGPLGRTAYFTYGDPLLLAYNDPLLLSAGAPLMLH